MTYDEAIKYAREISFCCGCRIDMSIEGNYHACDDCEHRAFFELAIEALEKQIPKKPDEYYDGYSGGYPVIEYTCPNCGEEVDDTDHHCVCGQTLNWDWSDEDEG